jgi:hypothetical protein
MSLQLAPMASGAGDLPPAAPQGGEPALVHVVQAGETLFSICESSQHFGFPVLAPARLAGRC